MTDWRSVFGPEAWATAIDDGSSTWKEWNAGAALASALDSLVESGALHIGYRIEYAGGGWYEIVTTYKGCLELCDSSKGDRILQRLVSEWRPTDE